MISRFRYSLAGMIFLIPLFLFSQGKKTEIILLHVNDMHSKIDNMARLAYLADSLRKTHPYVFLVSAGDNFTGNPVVDMVPDKGAPMVDLMNRCGFQASALGNHEFDMGQELLKKKMVQATFPFISCNTDGSQATIGPIQPYTILKAGDDVSIAFLGLIQLDDNGLPSAHPSNMKEVKFTNGLSRAKDFTWLKERYGVLIALSHLGLDADMRLADSLPQFDVIVGGHSHILLESPKFENGVMIVQAGANLKYIGKTTLTIEDGKVTGRSDEVIPLSTLAREDREIRQLIDACNDNPAFKEVVGKATMPLAGVEELGSLMTDAVTHQMKVDFAFQNKGGIRISAIPAGDITLRDVYKLDPFGNHLVIYSMTPDEIRSLICYGYTHEKGIDLQVSGMTYRIIGDGTGSCSRVEMFDPSGKPLDPKQEYSVAINDYMANTYRFDHKDPGTVSTLTTSEVLIRYLRTVGSVNYSGVTRAAAAN